MDDFTVQVSLADIFAYYIERMALYSYDVKECDVLIKKYITDNENSVMSYTKDILNGKYDLCFILGLRPVQRRKAVLAMASYACAAEKADMEYMDKIIDAFNKGKKSKQNEKIDISSLSSLFDRIIKDKNTNLAYEAISNSTLNTPSRAFLLAVAICKYGILDKPERELVLTAAYVALAFQRRVINGAVQRYPIFMKYLTLHSCKSIFSKTVLGDIFEEDTKFLKNDKGHESYCLKFGSYESRKRIDVMTMSTVLSATGLMQQHAMLSVSFSKAKQEQLSGQAYTACMFDSKNFPFDDIAQGFIDKDTSSFKEEDLEQFHDAVCEFELTLRRIIYISYLAEMYKRSVLAATYADIFNPDERKTRSKLDAAQKQLEQCQTKEHEELLRLKKVQEENSDISHQLVDARNKYAGLQGKINKQETQIEQYKAEIAHLEAEKRSMAEKISSLLPDENTQEETITDSEPKIDYGCLLSALLEKYKVVFVGGNENIMQKFSRKYPNACVVPKSRIGTSDALIETADVVLFKTDSMAHKDYYKVKRIAVKKNIPYDYLDDIANLQRFEQDVYVTLSDMGFQVSVSC